MSEGETVLSSGPWPFITRHALLRHGREQDVLSSRNHRKRLIEAGIREVVVFGRGVLATLWAPGQLNWWIGLVFAIGAALFMSGCVLVLAPDFAPGWSADANAVFFAGSIPFTTAAYLQLFQAANAGEFKLQGASDGRRVSLFGWRPREIGWLSCACQFVGTIFFNFNTFDATIPGLNWFQQDLSIWIPNVAGSVLFLVSGYLAFVETCHKHWAWKPAELSWWITFVNLLGCVAFMISAVYAFVPAPPGGFDGATIATVWTLIGGACFFVGSLLMLPELRLAKPDESQRQG